MSFVVPWRRFICCWAYKTCMSSFSNWIHVEPISMQFEWMIIEVNWNLKTVSVLWIWPKFNLDNCIYLSSIIMLRECIYVRVSTNPEENPWIYWIIRPLFIPSFCRSRFTKGHTWVWNETALKHRTWIPAHTECSVYWTWFAAKANPYFAKDCVTTQMGANRNTF